MHNIFKKLYSVQCCINIIDLTSYNINKYLEEIFLNIYGTGSKWFAFNILNELEWKNKIYSIKYFFRSDIHNLFKYDNWVEKYSPKLIKNSVNIGIENKSSFIGVFVFRSLHTI